MATVVVLNGTSSSGKTTVARAFQEVAPGLFLNFSIDSILSALPESASKRITNGQDFSDLNVPGLMRAFYACVRELLEHGHDLVIDNAVTSRYQAEALVAAVSSHRVLMVAVDCPSEVLGRREQERGDRRTGMAVAQQAHIHSWLLYDLRIDSSVMPAQEAAQEIVRALANGTADAFDRTRARLNAS